MDHKMDMLKMKVSTVLAIALTISLILVGIVGLILSYLNPINQWVLPYLSPCFDYVGCWVQPTLFYLDGVIDTLNNNWLVTLPTSLVVLAMGLLQPESRRNIRAFPRKVINVYRKVCVWRDILFNKIEYLNGESAKWKRTFNILKSPYSFLRMMGLSPQMAIGLLVAGSTATTAVTVAEVTQGRSFANGDAGIYSAPLDTPVFADQEYNTLRLDLGATSVGNITIENISLGTAYTGSALPSNAGGNVIYVGGIVASTDPTFNQTYLEVGRLIIDRWRCPRLDISDSEIHSLIVHGNLSDGQSISAVAGVPRDRGINGGNRADDMETKGGLYDMLKITAASSGVHGKVDVLKLSNIYARGGACTIKYVKAGTMEITLNEIGGDESLATKAFTIATSVIYKSFVNTSNIEASMALPAAQ
ncbi:hypothetical protein CL653_02070 [bacterium]|nr:hypothetical protein [bacterium]